MHPTARTLRSAATPALLALALMAGPALAQSSASAPMSTPAAAGKRTPALQHEAAVEQRIKQLHDQMQITAQQAPQWDAFAQAMRDNGKRAGEAYQEHAQKLSTMNADEAMKSYASLAQMHADHMQKLSAAFSPLYATLSNTQKATADRLFRHEHERHHGGDMHHGMRHGMRPGASSPAAAGG